jgi:hypothetical protein
MTQDTQKLMQRITDYLSEGGLVNPELADHHAVRDLLMDCRETLAVVGSQDADRLDAERYRALQKRDVTFETEDGPVFVAYIPELGHDGSNLDEHVDAARLAEKGKA